MNTSDQEIPRDPGTGASRGGPEGRPSPRGIAFATITSALAAALVAWAVGETPLVQVPAEMVPIVTQGVRSMATSAATELAAISTRSARSQAVFGTVLGLALGAAGGLARRSLRGGLTASLLGAVLGAVAGGAASYAGIPPYYRFRETFTNDLIPSFLLHGTTAAAVGAAAALALGIGAGSGGRRLGPYVVGGTVGAAIGAVLFVCLGAVFFAGDETGGPISTTANARLAARLVVALVFAIGVMATVHERRQTGSDTLRA